MRRANTIEARRSVKNHESETRNKKQGTWMVRPSRKKKKKKCPEDQEKVEGKKKKKHFRDVGFGERNTKTWCGTEVGQLCLPNGLVEESFF